MSEYFNTNLQYLFVHMLVDNKQFIIQYAHKARNERLIDSDVT